MISGVVLMTLLLPAQIAAYSSPERGVRPLFVVGAFVDSARILGLPKFRLRDSKGGLFMADKVLLQESLALIHREAGVLASELDSSKRKLYILAYLKR
jgi:hypothetical protein